VAAVERVVLPVFLGPGRFLVRVLVVPGGFPMLISRPTLTSLGANLEFFNHVLHLPDSAIPLHLSAVGHYVINALGATPPAAVDPHALVARAVLTSVPLPGEAGAPDDAVDDPPGALHASGGAAIAEAVAASHPDGGLVPPAA